MPALPAKHWIPCSRFDMATLSLGAKPRRTMRLITSLLFWLLFLSAAISAQQHLTDYVDPFIGTGGHGHTFPGATMPFGMVQLSPDTRLSGWDGCSGYHYSDNVIYGFSHTHLSGTGISDYGDILLMPMVGRDYSGRFQHQN